MTDFDSFDVPDQKHRSNYNLQINNIRKTMRALHRYGIDLIEMAEEGKFDPVIGRDDEIEKQSYHYRSTWDW